ncbi:16S rRNA processing protein RimM [Corynebacterium yudongzhengii]|uniref:16S rRNA processing protein RimM n=1 Tax=Corynebacterium yudongzhengii TaxID=2080740 RepID=A0A2U1T7A3_9CORY|nr:16S rRNA processing protein RimM [Corynebacterium yudongzhengii]PWC01886.1 16S rRNA processing protein RimM [Corynebacterium yudongzhengii]
MLGRFSAGTRCGVAIPWLETTLVTPNSMTVHAVKSTSSTPERV